MLKCTFPGTQRNDGWEEDWHLSNLTTYVTLRTVFPRPHYKNQCPCLENLVSSANLSFGKLSPPTWALIGQTILKQVSRFCYCYLASGRCHVGLLVQAICFPLHLGMAQVCLSEHVFNMYLPCGPVLSP